MSTATHIVLIAGHNSVGDGGNPVERNLTPKLAAAYKKAFEDAGYSVTYVNPTLTPGGLSGLASATARAIADAIAAGATLVIMLDLHFNGRKSGVHSIVAHNLRSDGRGQLSSGFVAGRDPNDLMENNTLDVAMASAISKSIVAQVPGMTLWGGTGVMRENQTGVGNNDGSPPDNARHGMMGATAGLRSKAVRLVVEHGGTDDADKDDFFNKCARAAVSAVTTTLAGREEGGQPVPPPQPEEPPKGDTGDPDLLTFLFGSAQGYAYDPNGPVSKLWREEGVTTARWPRLVDVRIKDKDKWFVFGDGAVIYAEAGKGVRYLEEIKEGE